MVSNALIVFPFRVTVVTGVTVTPAQCYTRTSLISSALSQGIDKLMFKYSPQLEGVVLAVTRPQISESGALSPPDQPLAYFRCKLSLTLLMMRPCVDYITGTVTEVDKVRGITLMALGRLPVHLNHLSSSWQCDEDGWRDSDGTRVGVVHMGVFPFSAQVFVSQNLSHTFAKVVVKTDSHPPATVQHGAELRRKLEDQHRAEREKRLMVDTVRRSGFLLLGPVHSYFFRNGSMIRSSLQGQMIELWGDFTIFGAELTEVKKEPKEGKRQRVKSSA